MNRNPEVSVSTLSADIIDENGKIIGEIQRSKNILTFSNHEYFDSFFGENSLSPIYPTAMYRTKFYENYKEYICLTDAGPAHDQLTWFQTERNGGKLSILPTKCFQYRVHSNQDSNIYSGFMELMLINFLCKDEYYMNLIKLAKRNVNHKIWRIFKQISLKYYKGLIDVNRYRSFFDFDFISNKTFKVLKYKFFFFNKHLLKFMYRVFIR